MGARTSSPTKRAMIKTGTYTGDGNDNRDIDIGINLASKQNVYITIKALDIEFARHRIEYGQGDLTMHFTNIDDTANHIKQFTSNGFRIGTGGAVNRNETLFRYIIFWEEP